MERLSDLLEQAAARGDEPLYVSNDETLSGRELYIRANALAARLHGAGIGPGSHVQIRLENSAAFLIAFFGVISTGGAIVLTDAASDPGLAGTSPPSGTPDALVTRRAGRVQVSFGDRSHPDVDLESVLADGPRPGTTSLPPSSGDPRETALVLCTSGSSGHPRGIVKTHANLMVEVADIARLLAAPRRRYLSVIPWSYIYGLLHHLLVPLYTGGTIHHLKGYTPQNLLTTIVSADIDVFVAVPALYRILATLPSVGRRDALVWAVSSGGPLEPGTIERIGTRLGWPIAEFYGSTETGGICCNLDKGTDLVTVGRPMPSVRVRVNDVAGTIEVAGATVSSHAVEAGRTLPLINADGWYDTLDTGRLEADGRLVIAGRLSRFVKVSGRRVSLDHIERTLLALPGVLDVAVEPCHDAQRGEAASADVVVDAASGLGIDELEAHCRESLPAYARPRRLRLRECILRVRGGKRPVPD